jgi:hypothetical protein
METTREIYIFNNKRYMKIKDCAEMCQCSVMTIRNLAIEKFRQDNTTYVSLEGIEMYKALKKITSEGRKKK